MEMSIRFPNLDLVFDFVPRSFYILGTEFTIYGVLIAVGALLGMGMALLETRRNHEDTNRCLEMMIISMTVAIVGSRLFYVIFSWDLYSENVSGVWNIRNGGYAFYGALLAGVIAAVVFCKVTKSPFWQMADTVSVGLLLGQTVGRFGNFFNRESFGGYTDSLLAMQIPLTAVRSGEVSGAMRDNLLTIDGMAYIQVHPVFLYESLWCLALLLMLLAIRRRKCFQGELFMRYLAGYGLGRFFFEWLRTDQLMIPGTQIGISMLISAVLFGIFAPAIVIQTVLEKKRNRAKKKRREEDYLKES